jgi:hypothetical protein
MGERIGGTFSGVRDWLSTHRVKHTTRRKLCHIHLLAGFLPENRANPGNKGKTLYLISKLSSKRGCQKGVFLLQYVKFYASRHRFT